MLETLKNISKDKTKEKLIYLLIMLIVVFIAFSYIFGNASEDNNSNSNALSSINDISNIATINGQSSFSNVYIDSYSENMEKRLKEILSKIDGVSNVAVMITYSELSEIVPIYNKNGEDESVAYNEENGVKEAIIERTLLPKAEGVIIVANGAENASIKGKIVSAVSNVTGVSNYKIEVFNGGEAE